jgi:prepilin-type N-terminal cleavage/methylation domain-containing protein
MQTRIQPHRGFTIVELMIVVAIIGLLMALLLPALSSALRNSHAAHDKVVIKGVGMAITNSAEDFDDRFLRPSLIARGPFIFRSKNYGYNSGKGLEGKAWDSTESLYSVAIALRYLSPETVVSPVDNNPMVGAKGDVEELGAGGVVAYDYSEFDVGNPANDVFQSPDGFWDTQFFCQLDDEEADMASYANQTLAGRRYVKWVGNARTIHPLFATRGVTSTVEIELDAMTDGLPRLDSDGYKFSPVLEMLGPLNTWNGHVYTSDGVVANVDNFLEFKHYTTGLEDGGSYSKPLPDNMFECEFTQEWSPEENTSGDTYGHGASDNFLSYTNNANADASWGMGAMFALPTGGNPATSWRYGSDSYFLTKRLTFDPLID